MKTITPQELNALHQSQGKIQLLDVRTPAEYRTLHAAFASNTPIESLDPAALDNGTSDEPIYVICNHGGRGKRACEKLLAAGCDRAINVEGGTVAWEAAGLPVVRGKKTISLERQVRIAAGLLVLVGAVLGLAVHPYWIGLSAFIGAGLIFAGITDTCGMGMMLARMPWNQVSGSCQTGNSCERGET